jgi:diguanylate cyclase (GGDEF)-like protein
MLTRSLQTRIVALFLALVAVVHIGGFVLINSIGTTATREAIGEDLAAGARVFDHLREQERAHLVQAATLLAVDPAFRKALRSHDDMSLTGLLERHARQGDAQLLMLIRRDGWVVADTFGIAAGEPFFIPRLLDAARASGPMAALVVLRGQLHQLVIVPLRDESPLAWIAVGYAVTDALALETARLLRLEVSFLSQVEGGKWKLQATTLAGEDRKVLLQQLASGALLHPDVDGNTMLGNVVARPLALPAQTDDTVAVVLQQPLATAMAPFRRLERRLGWISVSMVVGSLLASCLIARGIARPVRALAEAARRVAAGDYTAPSLTSRNDEIGDLATAFVSMQQGLASREQRIMNLAYRDTLTGLANRTLFAERLDRALAASGERGAAAAILVMDIDHFKYVNDTLGHAFGDQVLLQVAARLKAVVDRHNNTIARLGGDEFAILLPGSDAAQAAHVATATRSALEAPVELEGLQVDVQVSIGIAVSPDHGTKRSTLMRRADVAMYAAKAANSGVLAWNDRYDQLSRDRLALLCDLRRALQKDELSLVFQPQFPLADATGYYVEALIRWRHPTRGLVPPSEFIPVAEQIGYIGLITRWVLERALAQCAAWRRQGLPVNVAVNISARDVIDARFHDDFAELLLRSECRAPWVTLEITESAIMGDPEHAIATLGRLHALGCRLAIDDFGTGHSSLNYLLRLPVDELKIDRAFVSNMVDDRSNAVIVRSMIELAHNMGLTVVAEGVEDEATLDRLRALGCEMVQGYLVSRPMAAEEVAVWLEDSTRTRFAGEVRRVRNVA